MTDTKHTQTPEKATQGMSLRDWFAGQALAGITSPERRGDGGALSSNHTTNIAKEAYALADAMMKAREAQPND